MLAENWGATPAERAEHMPCDEILPGARFRGHRAITIDALPAVVFRWLCQLRHAPYSYDLLDNLGRRSPRTLTPGLDQLHAGQRFMSIFRLASFERDVQVTLESKAFAVTYALRPQGEGTRLLVCVLFDPSSKLGSALARPLAIGDLVMMRKQLLTLRGLAEDVTPRGADGSPAAEPTPRLPSA